MVTQAIMTARLPGDDPQRDWIAVFDDATFDRHDMPEDCPTGFGRTEKEAVAELLKLERST